MHCMESMWGVRFAIDPNNPEEHMNQSVEKIKNVFGLEPFSRMLNSDLGITYGLVLFYHSELTKQQYEKNIHKIKESGIAML
jgi:hypothetical protein